MMTRYKENKELIQLGAYQHGTRPSGGEQTL